MNLIRKNIFETNSSSTNCLVLGNELDSYKVPKKLTIFALEDGRDFEYSDVDSKFSVLASCCEFTSDFFYLCYKMYEFGVEEIVLPKTGSVKVFGNSIEIGNWEIDPENRKEIYEFLRDDEQLKNWLFNPYSYITGEDDNY